MPHFEKMLYDNAQLVAVYLDAYQVTGDDDLARVARETLDYVAREMTSAAGGFYSATDADSPVPGQRHEEVGWFFTWTPREIRDVVGDELGRIVMSTDGGPERGTFEGRNILHTPRPRAAVAGSLGLEIETLDELLEQARSQLYESPSSWLR